MGRVFMLASVVVVLLSCSGKQGGIDVYRDGLDGGLTSSRTNTQNRPGAGSSSDPEDYNLADIGPQDRKPSTTTNYSSTQRRTVRKIRDRSVAPPPRAKTGDVINFISRRSVPRRRVWISIRHSFYEDKAPLYGNPGYWRNDYVAKPGPDDPVWLLEEAVVRQKNDYGDRKDVDSKWVKLSFGTNQGWTREEYISFTEIPVQARRGLDQFADTLFDSVKQRKGLRQYLSLAGILFSLKYRYKGSGENAWVWCKDIRLTRDAYTQTQRVALHQAVNGMTHYDLCPERAVAYLDPRFMFIMERDYRQSRIVLANAREGLTLWISSVAGRLVVSTIEVFGFDP